MPDYVVGQRWISDTEPDLGLGHIQHVEHRRVTIGFEESGQTRLYATGSAPLTRVRFNPGDRVQSQHGWHMTVDQVEEDNEGLITYFGERDDGSTVVLPEAELAHHIHFVHFKKRPRPTMGEDQGHGIRPHSFFMNKVNAHPRHGGPVMARRVDQPLLGTPIKTGTPVGDQFLDIGQVAAIVPLCPGDFIRPAGLGQAALEVLQHGIRHVDFERFDIHVVLLIRFHAYELMRKQNPYRLHLHPAL